jgi:hypothetical protein
MPLIRLNAAELMPDLVDALRDAGCLATRVRGDACIVGPSRSDVLHFAVELAFFLEAWLSRHPGAVAEIVT